MDDIESLSSLTTAAALQTARCDWPGVLETAQRMRMCYPLAEIAYRYECEALSATGRRSRADAIAEAGFRLFPDSVWMARRFAMNAPGTIIRSEPAAVVEAAAPAPADDLAALLDQAAAARAAHRPRQASRMLVAAFDRFRDHVEITMTWARAALDRDDWREAVWRLQVLRDYHPDHPGGYAEAAHALRHLRLLEEADAITAQGLQRLPGNLEILCSHAWTAMVRTDWPQAEQRWRAVLESHPSSGHGYVGFAEACRYQHRNAEADAVLRAGLEAVTDNAAIAEAFAMLPTRLEDWPEAVLRWREVRDRFPGSGVSHHQLAIALRKTGDTGAAEAVIDNGVRLVSQYLPMAIDHAWWASARNDWVEALRRWEALSERFPLDIAVKEGLVAARLGAAEAGLHPMAGHAEAAEPAVPETDSPPEIFGQFEGLGENCEFGLTQRHFGLEPLSLFRWVAVGMPSLARALEDRLQGVGNPEQTILTVTEGREYYVSDRRYSFGMHTFVQHETIEADTFFAQQCRRLRYLAGKLLEDLTSAQKIFVFFQEGAVNEADLSRLHAAVRSYGAAALLQVRLSDADHAPGTVERAGPGLLIGFIGRFGKRPSSNWDIDYQGWLAICREALRLNAADVD